MKTKKQRTAIILSGILGVIALMISFSINPAPPAHANLQQIIVWGKQHEVLILLGAWLQGLGSLLEVIFIIAIIYLTNKMTAISGWLTAFAATTIMAVSLVEISFYISAVQGGVTGNLTLLSTSLNLIQAIQHAYVIVPAPVLLLGLGYILYTSKIVSPVFAYCAFILGCVLALLGFIGTFYPLQQIVDSILGIQELWFLLLAITLGVKKQNEK